MGYGKFADIAVFLKASNKNDYYFQDHKKDGINSGDMQK
jgi:hypothetical protein